MHAPAGENSRGLADRHGSSVDVLQQGEDFLDTLGDHELAARLVLAEFLGDAVVEKGEQRVIVTVLVEQDDRLAMQAPVLEVERVAISSSAPTPQADHKSVGSRLRQDFPLSHCGHDHHLVGLLVGHFPLADEFGDDADDATARFVGPRAPPHPQSGLPSAPDPRPLALGQTLPELAGNFGAFRIRPVAGNGSDRFLAQV